MTSAAYLKSDVKEDELIVGITFAVNVTKSTVRYDFYPIENILQSFDILHRFVETSRMFKLNGGSSKLFVFTVALGDVVKSKISKDYLPFSNR